MLRKMFSALTKSSEQSLRVNTSAPSPKSNERLKALLNKSKSAIISPRSVDFTLAKLTTHMEHKNTMTVCCQYISNYSMSQATAMKFMTLGASQKVLEILKRYPKDQRINWIACSTLWNLFRPQTTRSLIPANTVKILSKVLKNHSKDSQVLRCCLGALSNVAISSVFQRPIIDDTPLMKLIAEIWESHLATNNSSVTAAASGLFANLAICENAEDKLIASGVLSRLLQTWRKNRKDEIVILNVSAAFSNLSHGATFRETMIDSKGVEDVYSMRDLTSNPLVIEYFNNSLRAMNLSTEHKTTSLLVASREGKYTTCKKLLQMAPHEINKPSVTGMTALDYALASTKNDCVKLLATAGGQTLKKQDAKIESIRAMIVGFQHHASHEELYAQKISAAVPAFAEDISLEIVRYISGIERVIGAQKNSDLIAS